MLAELLFHKGHFVHLFQRSDIDWSFAFGTELIGQGYEKLLKQDLDRCFNHWCGNQGSSTSQLDGTLIADYCIGLMCSQSDIKLAAKGVGLSLTLNFQMIRRGMTQVQDGSLSRIRSSQWRMPDLYSERIGMLIN